MIIHVYLHVYPRYSEDSIRLKHWLSEVNDVRNPFQMSFIFLYKDVLYCSIFIGKGNAPYYKKKVL